jgi:heme exporter protein A
VSDGQAALVTQNLSRQFGELTALRSVSFEVPTGQSLAVFGRNGAGKTTLLKVIATLTRHYGGTVRLFGEDLRNTGDAIRRRIGFVSHESYLYADLSVRANLIFFAKLCRIADPHAAAEEMIDAMELRLKASSTVRSLSRGLKQRATLARAFIHKPDLLLLDEPFTGLDDRAADVLDRFIDTVRGEGRTIVVTTHDVARGWRHVDRALVLDRGGIADEADTTQVSEADFHASYRRILSGAN